MRKHLLAHIWPREVPHSSWRLTLRQIVSRWRVFDGVKCVAVAGSHDTAPVSAVRAELPSDCEVIDVPNDAGLREVTTFVPLLSKVKDEPGMTFYCHGKGSTHHEGSICQEWGAVMAEMLLDHVDMVEEGIRDGWRMVGCFRRNRRFGLQPDNWHYSGTFYWFDNEAVFRSRRDWANVDQVWFGTESWPGKMFEAPDVGCMFLDWVGDLYSEEYWNLVVRPALKSWRSHPVLDRAPPSNRCDFDRLPNSPGHNICRKCGKVVHDVLLLQRHVCGGGYTPAKVPQRRVCTRLGPRLRAEECSSCGPGKTAPVHECHVHGECLQHPVQGSRIRDCQHCDDFVPVLQETHSI